MMPPANPLRLQVIDRIVAVLKAIVAGDNYFYTPYEVNKRLVLPEEAKGFPSYSVHADSGGVIECSGAGADEYTADFFINVKGVVKDMAAPGDVLIKCHRDVCKAIDTDSISGTAGSLGALGVETRVEEMPATDNGNWSPVGFAGFDQRIRCRIAGSYGEL